MSATRKLYRDVENGKISGVCAGLSEYLQLDVTVIRVIMLILLFTGGGLLAYIIMWVIVDPKPQSSKDSMDYEINDDDDPFAKYDKK